MSLAVDHSSSLPSDFYLSESPALHLFLKKIIYLFDCMWHQVLLAAGRIYFPDQVFTPDPLHWECEVLASLNCISYFSVSEGYIAPSLFSVFYCFLPHLSSQAFSSTVFGE